MSGPTIGDIIAKHNEIKAFVEAADEKHDAAMKPYKEALRTLTTTAGVVLQEQGLQNFKAEGEGTAYLQHGLSVKVDNREAFLDFVITQNHPEFLDAGVLKDPVRDYLDKHQAPPPGVKTENFVKCLIRRS